jgi:hypothetical protein
MKNLQTFEEFVNESVINEGREWSPFEGDQLELVEQINKLTFEATNKILPKLAKKYGYKFSKLSDGDYCIRGKYEGREMTMLDFYTWTIEKYRKYRIIGYAYPNPFFENESLVMPFQHSDSIKTKESDEVVQSWNRLAEISLPKQTTLTKKLVDAYAKFVEDVIEGTELNLKFAKESGVE